MLFLLQKLMVSSHVVTREKHSEGDLARTELCLSLGSVGAVLDSFFERLKEKACLTLASEEWVPRFGGSGFLRVRSQFRKETSLTFLKEPHLRG